MVKIALELRIPMLHLFLWIVYSDRFQKSYRNQKSEKLERMTALSDP